MANLYIVNATGRGRAVVIARSASDAATSGANLFSIEPEAVEVGRLGTFEPGMEGHRLAPSHIVAIQRDAFPQPTE